MTIDTTNFQFLGQVGRYQGKVRDVYDLGDKLAMVTTDRYSAFDRNLALIPHKGQVVTQVAAWWFDQTSDIVENHLISCPDPNALLCNKYKVIPIEMIVRGYITGVTNTSLWHTYSEGQRDYEIFTLPDGLRKNDRLPEPVLTPTTKFEAHDRNLTPSEAAKEGLIDEAVWEKLQDIALKLFKRGQEKAEAAGLMLVDTKYEFGQDESGNIVLIDEIHTPDSSRFWLKETYEERKAAGQEPDNYDKEYLRLWFKERFDPYAEGAAPEVPEEQINELSRRYVYVYEALTGKAFEPRSDEDSIDKNIIAALEEVQNLENKI
ncbi:MAG TPA: phosphoribosylaminoimidazolesuccinocarboxamide synthase [Candidatus Saccharimonadales bacterium]